MGYAIAFVAIEFWPDSGPTLFLGIRFGLAVITFWAALFFAGLLSEPEEAIGA
jgi:hypothetical protein